MHGRNHKGFTLIEVLVSMVLVSMVTLVAAMALKMTIAAWARGVEEGESRQFELALPALLKNQLDSLVTTNPFDKVSSGRKLPFSGRENGFSFITSYAPQGAPWKGLLRVSYVFDEEKNTLYLYQQVITRKEDLNEEFNPLSDEWNKAFKPVSQTVGVTDFQAAYSAKIKLEPQDSDQWKDTWKSAASPPAGIRLRFQVGRKSAKEKDWYFKTGAVEL